MTRRSIISRYDASQALDSRADELTGALPAALRAQLTETHVKAAEVLSNLLDMGGRFTDDDTPQTMRVLVTMLRRSRPMLLEGIGKIPPAEIIGFMRGLRDELDAIIATGDDDTAPAPAPAEAVTHDDGDAGAAIDGANLDRNDLSA